MKANTKFVFDLLMKEHSESHVKIENFVIYSQVGAESFHWVWWMA